MPANAVPVRPTTTAYKLFRDPPCYEYTTPRGLVVMECHGSFGSHRNIKDKRIELGIIIEFESERWAPHRSLLAD